MNKGAIAERLGVSRTMLFNYEKGNPPPPPELLLSLDEIEREGGIEHTFTPEEAAATYVDPRAEGLPERKTRYIPVIGWAHAGEAVDYEESPDSWHERVPTECRDKAAFALRLEGISMEPRFQDGDQLIISPSTPLYSGCFAVSKFKNDGGVLFRQIEMLPTSIRLVALNPKYESREYPRSDFAWIYPVFGRWTQFLK